MQETVDGAGELYQPARPHVVPPGLTLGPRRRAVQAVVFDLFITLTDFDAERRRPQLVDELASALGVDPVAFSSLMRATFTERVTGKLGDARSTIRARALRLGCEPSDEALDQVMALRYHQQRRMLAPRAGVIDVIGDICRAGYATGILTDCTSETVGLWPSLPYAGVVDAVTFSCEVGHRKPAPAGYLDIAGKLGVTPEECVYVGDGSSSELTGATAAGMTAVLLETPLDPTFRYDAEARWDGRAIADLQDLPGVLRELHEGRR